MQEETVEITLVPVNVWKNLVYTKQVMESFYCNYKSFQKHFQDITND